MGVRVGALGCDDVKKRQRLSESDGSSRRRKGASPRCSLGFREARSHAAHVFSSMESDSEALGLSHAAYQPASGLRDKRKCQARSSILVTGGHLVQQCRAAVGAGRTSHGSAGARGSISRRQSFGPEGPRGAFSLGYTKGDERSPLVGCLKLFWGFGEKAKPRHLRNP